MSKRDRAYRRKQRIKRQQRKRRHVLETWGAYPAEMMEQNPDWHKRFAETTCWSDRDFFEREKSQEKAAALLEEEGLQEYYGES